MNFSDVIAIPTKCQRCEHDFRFKSTMFGQVVKCPKCSGRVRCQPDLAAAEPDRWILGGDRKNILTIDDLRRMVTDGTLRGTEQVSSPDVDNGAVVQVYQVPELGALLRELAVKQVQETKQKKAARAERVAEVVSEVVSWPRRAGRMWARCWPMARFGVFGFLALVVAWGVWGVACMTTSQTTDITKDGRQSVIVDFRNRWTGRPLNRKIEIRDESGVLAYTGEVGLSESGKPHGKLFGHFWPSGEVVERWFFYGEEISGEAEFRRLEK